MSTAAQNAALGRYGERVAERVLVESGMVVLDRNWRCADGEIDLVLRDGADLVLCEVKTRRDTTRGHPLEAVDERKAERLMRLAARWIEAHGTTPPGIRLDVVAVLRPRRGAAVVEHVRGLG